MVEYKLTYFDVRGLAESIRLIFHYAKQNFQDIKITHEQFAQIKSTLKYGQVPFLEVDGKKLYQSSTIARYLGEKFGLAGKNEWERALVNEAVDYIKDVRSLISPYIYVVLGYRKGNKAELREEVFVPKSKELFPIYEQLLKDANSGFIVSSGVTFVDFIAADTLEGYAKIEPSILTDYPKIAEHIKLVHSLPQLKDYLSKRQ